MPKRAAALIFILLAGSILLSNLAVERAGQNPSLYGNDFTVFYAAARNLLQKGDPYNHPLAVHTPYLYPPLFALLMVPLTLLSLPNAALVWCWLNLIAALLLIIFTTRLLASPRQSLAGAILAIMLARIIFDNLFWG